MFTQGQIVLIIRFKGILYTVTANSNKKVSTIVSQYQVGWEHDWKTFPRRGNVVQKCFTNVNFFVIFPGDADIKKTCPHIIVSALAAIMVMRPRRPRLYGNQVCTYFL